MAAVDVLLQVCRLVCQAWFVAAYQVATLTLA
jgi:hypothetical protein